MFNRVIQGFQRELFHLPRQLTTKRNLKNLFKKQEELNTCSNSNKTIFKKPIWILSAMGGTLGACFFWNRLGLKKQLSSKSGYEGKTITQNEDRFKLNTFKQIAYNISQQLQTKGFIKDSDMEPLIFAIVDILDMERFDKIQSIHAILTILSNFPPLPKSVLNALIDRGHMKMLLELELNHFSNNTPSILLNQLMTFPEGIDFLKSHMISYNQNTFSQTPVQFSKMLNCTLRQMPNKTHLIRQLLPMEILVSVYRKDIFLLEILAWAYPTPPPHNISTENQIFLNAAAELQTQGSGQLAAKIRWSIYAGQLSLLFKEAISVDEIKDLIQTLPWGESYAIKKQIIGFLIEGEHFNEKNRDKLSLILQSPNPAEDNFLLECFVKETIEHLHDLPRERINFLFYILGLELNSENKVFLNTFEKKFREGVEEIDFLKRIKSLINLYKKEKAYLKSLPESTQRIYKQSYQIFVKQISSYFDDDKIKAALASFE